MMSERVASMPRLPARKVLLLLAWGVVSGYVIFFAPPDRGTTMQLIQDALFLRTDRVDPAVIAVFNLLGVVPGLYACLLIADGAGRKLPAWPFVIGSCCVGAFALLPYLALREDDGLMKGDVQGAVRFFDSRLVGLFLFASASSLLFMLLFRGSLDAYLNLFWREPLVHVMTLDLVVLCVVFPSVLGADMERRNMRDRRLFWLTALLPIVGPATYVALRKPLPA